ncbi:MAG: DEAD/DEAH box helicase [Candidatus Micrarchaeia archaeon]
MGRLSKGGTRARCRRQKHGSSFTSWHANLTRRQRRQQPHAIAALIIMVDAMSVYDAFLGRYGRYTNIQKIAMPVVESGRHCILTAPTGSGKTEAAVLPLIEKAGLEGKEGIKIIYITPLRALNRDMLSRLEWLCSEAGITIGVRHSDTTAKERSRQARNAPTLLVTTPETLQSVLPTKSFRNALRNVKAVVVDEVHELYYSKRGAQLSLGLERLEELAPGFQRIGLSATISDIELAKRFLCGTRECSVAGAALDRKLDIRIDMPESFDKKLEPLMDRFGLDKKALARLSSLVGLVKSSKSTLIFANTRQVVEAVGSRLMYIDSIEPFGGVGVHHGSLDKEERIGMEQDFKAGRIKALIATSSLELGIDIGSIDLVVQYGSPKQALRLVQRVGRSGHTLARTPRGVIIPTSEIDALESMAITKNVLEGKLEVLAPNVGALDVIANQVCGIALDKGSARIEEVHAILGRSYAYGHGSIERLRQLLEFMGRQRLVGFDGSTVTSGPRTRMYYYGHLSVIPDVQRFAVKNIIDNRIISSLDEKFVASDIDEGTVFITKGLPWKVVSIDESAISVEPSTEVEAAVPDWSGEDIPVSKQVVDTAFALLAQSGALFARQGDFFTPVKSTLFIEELGDACAIYTGLGTQANEALSRLVSYLISARYNKEVLSRSSPYMILVEATAEQSASALKGISQKNIRALIEEAVRGSELFRYRFVTVAKLFGIIEKDATLSKSIANRIIRVLRNSPVYEETMRELIENYFDIGSVEELVRDLSSGQLRIEVVRKGKMSPLTDSIINSAYYTRELIAPRMQGDSLINSFTDSLLSKSMKFICTYCGFTFERKLSEIKDTEIKCPSCGSPMVAPYSDAYAKIMGKKLQRRRLSRVEARTMGEMLSYADLISSYGGRAAVALSVYGVGLRTASRVLMMLKHEERSFFLDLIDAQKTFIRTKKYWSV